MPTLAAYLRATVVTWKYEPVAVDGRPGCVASEYSFVVNIP